MTTTIIFSIVFLALGLALGYLFAHLRSQRSLPALISERDVLKSKVESLQTQLSEEKAEAAAELQTLKNEALQQFQAQKAEAEQELQAEKDEAAQQLKAQKAEAEQQKNDLRSQYERQKQEMEAHYREQLDEFHRQQREQMAQQSNLIREQINTASEEILKKRQDELSETNREQLAQILNPLHENLNRMREAVEKSDREQTTSMERLDASIKENLKQAREVGERADRLAQALTGENKTQGNFGELKLRTLLENMGLEEGTQFEEQVTLRDEQTGQALHDRDNGQRLQPDVVLHFPDERDVIIDSKMSLKAFLDYYEAETDDERQQALQRHVASVRKHVNELSQKNYSSFIKKGHNKLDFVVMYVYNEGALQLALTTDPSLWQEAYNKGVVISGSQNLYMMLRVLEISWRQMHQVQNQDNIMQTANEIVSRVQLFYERFLRVDDLLDKTRKAFEDVKRTTADSGQSISVSARKLIKYGAKEDPKRKNKLPAADDDKPDEALPETV